MAEKEKIKITKAMRDAASVKLPPSSKHGAGAVNPMDGLEYAAGQVLKGKKGKAKK